jgi:putative inorganic carbon (HCO3(-)) transporter
MKVNRRLRRIAWLEPFWVLAIGVALLLPQRFLPANLDPVAGLWHPLMIVLLLMGWPLRALAYGKLTCRTPLDWPLLLLILCIPVSFWASSDRAVSWEAAGYLAFGLALFFALINWPPARRRPEWIAWTLMGIGLGLALVAPLMSRLAVAQLSRLPLLGMMFERIGPKPVEDVNINVLAGSVVLVLPLWVSMALRRGWQRSWLTVLFAAGALGILAVILMTGSRGAYSAMATGIALVAVLRWPRLLVAVAAAIIAGAIGVLVIGPTRSLEIISFNGALGGLNGRAEVWSRALYALQDFAMTGIGLGTFSRLIPFMYPYTTFAQGVRVDHAHNLFLQVGLDLGLPGLIAYLALLINAFVLLGLTLRPLALRERRSSERLGQFRSRDTLVWCTASGVAGGLAAMLAHGLFDATIWNSRPAFLPWVLIALSVLVGLRSALQDVSRNGSTPDSFAIPN